MLEGIITAFIGFCLCYLYVNDTSKVIGDDGISEDSIKRPFYLALAVAMFVASFFVSTNVYTITTTGSVQTYSYMLSVPIGYAGYLFTVIVVVTIFMLALMKLVKTVTHVRF